MKSAPRTISLLFLAILTASTLSAQKDTGGREIVAQSRQVAPFHSLDLSGSCEVILIQGEPQSLIIETLENLQEKVNVKVENGILFLSDKGVNKPNKLLFTVTMPMAQRVNVTGASNLKGEGIIRGESIELKASGATSLTLSLDVDLLRTEVSGAATMKLAGRAAEHETKVSGAADLKAQELETQKAVVKVSGAGNARLDVTEELTSDVSGAGDISLKRDPVTQKSTGKGSSSATVVTAPGIKVISTKRGDSTVVKIGDLDIEVIDRDSTVVKIGGAGISIDEKGNVKMKRQRKHRFDGHWGGFELGINGLLNADNGFSLLGADKHNPGYSFLGDLNLGKSINVKINFFEQNFNLVDNHLGLVTGLGLEYANYRFDNNIKLFPDSATIMGLPMHDDVNYSKSKLVVNYLNLPLIIEYQTNRFSKINSFHISAGILAGLRIGSHSKMVYQSSGKEKAKTRDDFHINPLKYEALVRIGWGIINLNAHYSLNSLFRDERGPEMYPFAIGLTLTSW